MGMIHGNDCDIIRFTYATFINSKSCSDMVTALILYKLAQAPGTPALLREA
jgi:hypothetical protein